MESINFRGQADPWIKRLPISGSIGKPDTVGERCFPVWSGNLQLWCEFPSQRGGRPGPGSEAGPLIRCQRLSSGAGWGGFLERQGDGDPVGGNADRISAEKDITRPFRTKIVGKDKAFRRGLLPSQTQTVIRSQSTWEMLAFNW